ncbi:GNAT family N-acetyltransferase [Tropicimonas isoalkanivorans]|uniref:Acetyltransferase, GNAT family n=1 Tax=Tropicimonas isoalkanivorans TaxID=441112 RepID=A0A1I1JHQ9_9RHOB|nr:GNAT family N-acetyltransferase [Tropicimonas isoalkanivorans]SFC47885.1 Acetyltransferase, GNAT family [Tropicimonas isoalkanivorans]
MLAQGLTIRATRASDIAAVDALLAQSYPALLKANYPPSVLVTALPIISRARPELVTCGTYYLAETSARAVVGAGGWTPRRNRPGEAEIRHVVTHHRHARQGIGRAIFDRIFADASRAGMTSYHCLATRTAVPFYQALGFAVLGPVDVLLAPGIGFPAIEMRKAD